MNQNSASVLCVIKSANSTCLYHPPQSSPIVPRLSYAACAQKIQRIGQELGRWGRKVEEDCQEFLLRLGLRSGCSFGFTHHELLGPRLQGVEKQHHPKHAHKLEQSLALCSSFWEHRSSWLTCLLPTLLTLLSYDYVCLQMWSTLSTTYPIFPTLCITSHRWRVVHLATGNAIPLQHVFILHTCTQLGVFLT